jgi:hypothetical protein
MARIQPLFDLVHSLSMQERRHFKLFAQRYSAGGSNYIRLFDALAALPEYDGQKLKRRLKEDALLKHLAFEKHRLAVLIRRALRVYHDGRTVDIRIKEILIDAEIMHEKSLYGHCRKLLGQARKTAQLYERFAFIPEITRLESRLFDLDNLQAVYEEERDALKKMDLINRYRQLSNKLARWVATSHQVRTKGELAALDAFLRNPLMRSEAKADTFTARVYFFYIQSVCREMKGDLAGAYSSRRRFVELIESDPVQLEVHAKNYISALNNLAISQLELGHYRGVRETIGKLKTLAAERKGRAEDVQVSSFTFSAILELNLAIRTGHFAAALPQLPLLEKQLRRLEEKILPQFRIVIFNSLKYVYFGAGELRRSLHWSNRVIASGQGVRQDIQSMSRIFNLILHYELGNTDLLDHIVRSTYRFLLSRARLYKVETVLLNYLRSSAHLSAPKELLASFRRLRAELEPLARDAFERKAFSEFDLMAWLDAKIEGKSFAEKVRARVKKD